MSLGMFKIATRLRLGFGVFAVLLALMGLGAYLKVQAIGVEVHHLTGDLLPKQAALTGVVDEVNQIARGMRNLLIMSDPAQLDQQRRELRDSDEVVARLFEQLDKTLVDPEARALLAPLHQARDAFAESQQRYLRLLEVGQTEAARQLMLSESRPLQQGYMQAIEGLVRTQDAVMTRGVQEIDAAIAMVTTLTWATTLAGLLLATLLSWAIIRSITRPIDEAVHVAQAIAKGQLAQDIAIEGRSETTVLQQALARMRDQLAHVVGQVRTNADSVAIASTQIAQGNQDLSSRTEEQASALQQTAASMEQLGSTVRHNAESAAQANELAQRASTVAVQGGAVVEEVVSTMGGIQDSSKRIAEIISVIDGIAFQTNILALNAAVEAARAGEQGRGFAVVAAEVRGLAQRSATAAREIKALITDSVAQVGQGTELVHRAGHTMREVVTAIRRVTELVGEISHASQEQSAGVGQVADAVSQMDQVTQQNAALVEESAAAAESLRAQAQALVKAVSVFELKGHTATQACSTADRPAPEAAGRSAGSLESPELAAA